jgi:hypothetical protein
MTYDRSERMDDEQKEVADSWAADVYQPMTYRRSGETITYDPHTQTERYQGDDSLDGGSVVPPLRGTDGRERAARRTIIDDDVETAAEITPDWHTRAEPRSPVSEPTRKGNAGSGMGFTGIGLSILSLFLLPYLLAPIGIVLGYLAFRRGARTTGVWAMVVGAVAILGAILIYPYFVAR